MNALTSGMPHLLVRMDLLREGDVIVTYDPAKVTHLAIKALNQSDYAHAALALCGWLYVESDLEKGVAERVLNYVGSTLIDGKPAMLGALASNPKEVRVLRHPGYESFPTEAKQKAKELLRSEAMGRSYPKLESLASHVRSKEVGDEQFWSELGKRIDSRHKPKIAIPDGAFCTELIGIFFDYLGLNLFREYMQPVEKVAPVHLTCSACLLENVPEAIVSPNGLVFDGSYAVGKVAASDFAMSASQKLTEDIDFLNTVAQVHQLLIKLDKAEQEQKREVAQCQLIETSEMLREMRDLHDSFCTLCVSVQNLPNNLVAQKALRYFERLSDEILAIHKEGWNFLLGDEAKSLLTDRFPEVALQRHLLLRKRIGAVRRSKLRKTALLSAEYAKASVPILLRIDRQDEASKSIEHRHFVLLAARNALTQESHKCPTSSTS